MMRPIVAGACAASAMLACAPSTETADGAWVGTITTEGDVTTVVNQSGSVWGGTATLVEEASIGVEAGADEYMFGSLYSLYATDERIHVVDDQVPALRVYDIEGDFVHDLGRQGQGPGEYLLPTLVSADSSGRVFLMDSRLGRINVYGPEGENLDPLPLPQPLSLGLPMHPFEDGVLQPMSEPLDDEYRTWRWGLQPVGPEGPYGEITWVPNLEFDRAEFPVPSGRYGVSPFSPWQTWNPMPDGGFVVGASNEYRFEIHRPDGDVIVVDRYWNPVAVSAEQKEWERRRTLAFERQRNDPATTWDGAEMPDHKPAYRNFFSAVSGEVLVSRYRPSLRVTDCVEDPLEADVRETADRPCWTDELVVDVFDADGRYLGELEFPAGLRHDSSLLSIDLPRLIGVVQDEAGTIMVKRYRVVLPSERADDGPR